MSYIDALVSAGVKRQSAQILLFINRLQQTSSKEIEKELNLRQPDVSVALSDLEEHGWIDRSMSKKKTFKGRPEKVIVMAMSIPEIIQNLVSMEKEKIGAIHSNIETLRKMAEAF